jgi:hypothetical protein
VNHTLQQIVDVVVKVSGVPLNMISGAGLAASVGGLADGPRIRRQRAARRVLVLLARQRTPATWDEIGAVLLERGAAAEAVVRSIYQDALSAIEGTASDVSRMYLDCGQKLWSMPGAGHNPVEPEAIAGEAAPDPELSQQQRSTLLALAWLSDEHPWVTLQQVTNRGMFSRSPLKHMNVLVKFKLAEHDGNLEPVMYRVTPRGRAMAARLTKLEEVPSAK